MTNPIITLLDGITAPSESEVFSNIGKPHRTHQGSVSGTGAVSATIIFYVSNDKVNWLTLGTITLSDTDNATDGFTSEAPWKYTKAAVTNIAGTNAEASAYMGT